MDKWGHVVCWDSWLLLDWLAWRKRRVVQESFRHPVEVATPQRVRPDIPFPAQVWDNPVLAAVGIHQHTNTSAWKSLVFGAQ